MPALIDNYTTHLVVTALNPSVCDYRPYIERDMSGSGIVVKADFSNPYALNSRIIELLNAYSELKNNWDEDGALAPSPTAVQRARFLASLLERHGHPIFHAAPGPDGEIMLDIRNKTKKRSVEIIFYPNREVVVFFPDTEQPYQEVFADDKMPEILQWLNKK
ncbi:MAG: hypothetical protein IBJ09_04715 [Bacteroidia bacterium]|nr:hypothetical protein [Bacteroidia bacterium]